jgi:hypothetical protein
MVPENVRLVWIFWCLRRFCAFSVFWVPVQVWWLWPYIDRHQQEQARNKAHLSPALLLLLLRLLVAHVSGMPIATASRPQTNHARLHSKNQLDIYSNQCISSISKMRLPTRLCNTRYKNANKKCVHNFLNYKPHFISCYIVMFCKL